MVKESTIVLKRQASVVQKWTLLVKDCVGVGKEWASIVQGCLLWESKVYAVACNAKPSHLTIWAALLSEMTVNETVLEGCSAKLSKP